MPEPVKNQPVAGWGRYPVHECREYRPEKRRSIGDILGERAQPNYIARGLGRSYGDTAINEGGGVISCLRLDRMLGFDEATGVLHCEAGVSFSTIIDVFLPRGYFIPVTPGTKLISIGGAIANDVHGKNHHRDGSFGHSLIEFELQLPSGEIINCSREQNAEIFWATVGGIGLTGIILTAKFRLRKVPSGFVTVDYLKTKDLDGVLSAIHESDATYQYSMAWVDCLASGRSLGRSVLMRGNHVGPGGLPAAKRSDPFNMGGRFSPTLPFDFPQFALNPLSIRAFNVVFYALSPGGQGVITDCDRYFFPLDSIHHWNRMYGKRGFVQYQVTVPTAEVQAIVEILQAVAKSGKASFLAVLKKFGQGNEGLLSHPIEGFTLTLDFAVNDRLAPFLRELDKTVLKHNGRLYLAKDAVMTPETFRAMYPRWEEYKALRQRIDPDNLLSSSLSRRVGLTP